LNDAIAGGVPEDIADAQAYLDDMNAKLAKSQQTRSNLNDVSAGGISFLTAQANIAKCKSLSLGLS
jgi:uncharacterized protein (DUF2236 family)